MSLERVNKKTNRLAYLLLFAMFGTAIYFKFLPKDFIKSQVISFGAKKSERKIPRLLKEKLNLTFGEKGIWPEKVKLGDNKNGTIEYTFNDELNRYIKKLLKRYSSDYSTVIVIDNNSGEVLSALGYEGRKRKFNLRLPFTSTHPSASLFKIITSAELIQNTRVKNFTVFDYRGRGSTLYKYQLQDHKTKWSRYISFEKAFASSNNVVFAKAAINNISGVGLFKMAKEFGFNQELMTEISLAKSNFEMPKNQYNLAELASGFNKITTMSPIHGALLASIVANDGILKFPRIVSEVIEIENKKNVWKNEPESKRVVNDLTSTRLQKMMERAVEKGTARRFFNTFKKSLREKLIFGGKTGSLTGGVPYGKRDWFTVYAKPKDEKLGKGISVCVMNVNVEKWYVKSTYMAKNIVEYYYKKINPMAKLKNIAVAYQ